MLSESGRVVARRFTGRLAESALLVLAVALGVGAASAGFSLLANAMAAGRSMLASPSYRELVVSTRSSAQEMTAPAVKRPAQANAALTAADLDAAGVVPSIAYAYVQNRDDLQFVNAASVQREDAMAASFRGLGAQVATNGQGGVLITQGQQRQGTRAAQAQQDPGGPPGFRGMTEDDLKKAQAQADIIIVDGMDRLNGYQVTPQFFDAWSIKAAQGSLLTSADAKGSNLVLGSLAAAKIAGAGRSPAELLGKKLLTREGYASIVGVAAATGNPDFDQSYFSAYQAPAAAPDGGPPRFMRFNTQLRFSVSDPARLSETEGLLSDWFAAKLGEGQAVISNPRSQAQRLIDRNAGIGLLILFLSTAGLFIALVNVSHILMSRGLRMRKSVGIMMALGASRASIMRLFAAEGTAVAAAGALLGGIFALPLSSSMQSALGLAGGSWSYVILGLLISWSLTMAFSLVPAWQSSRIVPADAMRAA